MVLVQILRSPCDFSTVAGLSSVLHTPKPDLKPLMQLCSYAGSGTDEGQSQCIFVYVCCQGFDVRFHFLSLDFILHHDIWACRFTNQAPAILFKEPSMLSVKT